MSLIIHRCIKRPGLIDRARTFYLECNDKGLYIICLGNATQEIPRSDNFVANAIAGKAIHFIGNQYEKKIRETEQRILDEGVDALTTKKHSHFLTRSQIENFEYTILNDGTAKVKIKGVKTNLTLFSDQYYGRVLQEMKQHIQR